MHGYQEKIKCIFIVIMFNAFLIEFDYSEMIEVRLLLFEVCTHRMKIEFKLDFYRKSIILMSIDLWKNGLNYDGRFFYV
jgi:hypothetical protein